MAIIFGFTFAVLVLVSGVVAGQHQRLFETRLSIDGQAGSNGAPIRTTGYFNVRADYNSAHTSCPAIVVATVYTRCHAMDLLYV